MRLSCVLKPLLIVGLSSVVAVYLYPYLGLETAPRASLFSTGVFAGCILGVMMMCCRHRSACHDHGGSDEIDTLYVGNIPFKVTEEEIETFFSKAGYVEEVRIVRDKRSGRSKGYAFVEIESDGFDEALDFDGKELGGRALRVKAANEKKDYS
ncbi:MAG: hypothetical protein R8M38_06710 [Mariprofundaceae bacterium]